MPIQVPQDKYVNVGTVKTRYWAEGDQGPAALLVHGLGGFIENWAPNIGPLSQRHRVFALDLLGFGRTDKKPLIRSMYDLVRFIDDFMQVLQIEKACLVGNSLGGGLVLQLAIQHPEKVTGLILVDNAGMGRETVTDLKIMSIPFLGELLSRPSRKGTANLWKQIVYDPSIVTDDLVDLGYELITLPGAFKSLLHTIRAGVNIRGQRGDLVKAVLENIGSIKVPTMIFWGKQDPVLPVAHAYKCQKCLPGSELHVFDKCGHTPQLEHPEEFNRLVLDFLDRQTLPVK